MVKYMLIKYVLFGDGFGNQEVLGTFDDLDNVNEFLYTSPDYPDHIKFISCPQIIESKINDVCTKLELTTTQHNRVDKIGELSRALDEEETLLDLLCARDQDTDNLTAHDDEMITCQVRHIGKSELFLNFTIFGISLLDDGTWLYEYTGYGSDYDNEEGYN